MVLIFGFVEGVHSFLEPIVRISNQLSSSDLATFLMSQQILPSFSFDSAAFPWHRKVTFFLLEMHRWWKLQQGLRNYKYVNAGWK